MTCPACLRRPALGLLLTLLLTAPALAQTAGYDDLRALRFYLQQEDSAAVQAELRRLRTAFPDWRPPEDLDDLLAPRATATVDEAAIWAAIERRDFTGARARISDARARVPDWTPPAEMLRQLDTNEAQAAFDAAADAGNATEAIAVARRAPRLMSCARINNAWRLAEMYAAAGQGEQAVATYRNTLQSCTGFEQMKPTLQKASAVASDTQLTALFDTARARNAGAGDRLDALEAELTGAAPSAAGTGAVRQPTPRAEPAPRAAAPPRSPDTRSDLPLRGDGRVAEARRFKQAEQHARCLAASRAPRSLELLYERAWCLYSHDRPTEALVGFQRAARAGDRLGPDVGRDAQYGLALAYLAMDMTEQGAQAAAQARLSDTQRREIEAIVLDQRGVRAFRREDFRQAIGYFDALEQLEGSLRRDLAILRAYAYLNSGQRVRARDEFQRLHRQLATSETRAGLNAALGN